MILMLQLLFFCLFFAYRRRKVLGLYLRAAKEDLLPESYRRQPIVERYLGNEHGGSKGARPWPVVYNALVTKGWVRSFHLGILHKDGISYRVVRERFYHKILKFIGLACELQTGDRAFDKRYYLITHSPAALDYLLASSDLLERLKTLLAMPVKSVVCTRERVWCVIDGKHCEDGRPVEIERYIDLLCAVSDASRETAVDPIVRRHTKQHGRLAVLFMSIHAAAFGGVALGGAALVMFGADIIDESRLAGLGGVPAFFLVVVWFITLIALFIRTSWFGWVMTDFLLFGFIGVLFGTVLLVRDMNITLPQAKPEIRYQKVVGKACSLHCKRKWSKHSHAEDFPIDPKYCAAADRQAMAEDIISSHSVCQSSASFKLEITLEGIEVGDKDGTPPKPYVFKPRSKKTYLFDESTVGSYLMVPVHPGAFGIAWVDPGEFELDRGW